jgi:hypothetical protein
MKLNLAAGSLFGRVNHAGIKRPRVYVKADGPLIEFPRIYDSVHGVSGIHGAGMGNIHFNCVGGFEAAVARLQVLMNKMKVFDM